MNKKVLIITYYWPPAGGPGVQRWLKFATYLPNYGITPVVYKPQNADYPILDASLKEEVPEGIEIISQPIFEPYSIARLFSKKKTNTISSGIIKEEKQSIVSRILLYIRGNFFIPDARKYWVKPSIKYLSAYIEANAIDTIITTGPPHSVHLIGLGLQKRYGLKWIADFRDPWTSIGYHKKLKLGKLAALRHKQLEKKVLSQANQIITTSLQTQQEFSQITKQPISVITNGYEFLNEQGAELDKEFTLSHIGSLLTGRNPTILWEVLSELISENAEFKASFKLQLAGTVGVEVLENIRTHKLEEHTARLGYVSHQEALKLQAASQLLLLIEINSEETKGIIAGKLFEYMASRRPILAIGPKDADMQLILNETNTGMYFNYDDKSQLKSAILSYFQAFKKEGITANTAEISHYSRKALTKKLADLI